MPKTTVHDLELEQDMFDDTWTALCSCGWESKERNAEASAIEDWSSHCDMVFMESTYSFDLDIPLIALCKGHVWELSRPTTPYEKVQVAEELDGLGDDA